MTHEDFCAQHLPRGGAVLDVGAGRGRFMVAMAKCGFRASGVEINPAYRREAETAAIRAGVSINVRAARAEALPFPDASFDFVNCAEVTEHVDDPQALCREISRVLRPDAAAYVSFHNRFGIYDYHYHCYGINWLPRQIAERLLQWLGRQKDDSQEIGRQKLLTMHYFSFKSAARLLRDAGLSVTDVRIGKIQARYGRLAPLMLLCYRIFLRPFYFNTFHLIARKSPS